MQTLITIAILSLAVAYLAMKWMPAQLKQNIHARLLRRSPAAARRFAGLASYCASSCSSSCNSCESQNGGASVSSPDGKQRVIQIHKA